MFTAQHTDENHIVLALFLPFRRNEFQTSVGDFGDWQRARIPPTTDNCRFQLTVFLAQFEPGWILTVWSLQG